MGSVQQREHEFERWPKYKNLYLMAFQQMIDKWGGGTQMKKEAETQTIGSNGSSQKDFHSMTANEWMEWWIQ
jgi:hypothetical protein